MPAGFVSLVCRLRPSVLSLLLAMFPIVALGLLADSGLSRLYLETLFCAVSMWWYANVLCGDESKSHVQCNRRLRVWLHDDLTVEFAPQQPYMLV